MVPHPSSANWRTWLNLATVVFSVWFLLVLAQESGVTAIHAAFETVHAVVGVVPAVERETVNRVLGQFLRVGLVAAISLFSVAFYVLTKETEELETEREDV